MSSLHLRVDETAPVRLSVGAEMYGPPSYTGPVTVIPSQSAQVLGTAGRALFSDITIEPIPSNFGLITWDGSTITVS